MRISDWSSDVCSSDLVDAAFKRLTAFFEASLNKGLARELEVTSPEYGLARQIADRKGQLRRTNLILVSERTLSDRLQSMPDGDLCGVPARYHIWDKIGRASCRERVCQYV